MSLLCSAVLHEVLDLRLLRAALMPSQPLWIPVLPPSPPQEVFDLKPLRAALDAAASGSGSCSLETNGAQLSWGSDGMSPAAGSDRSEQGGL